MLANLSGEIDFRLTENGICSLADAKGLLRKDDLRFCGGMLYSVKTLAGNGVELVCSRCGSLYAPLEQAVDPERLYGGQATSRLVFGNALGSPHETRNADGSSEMYKLHGDNGRYVTRIESKKLQDALGTKTWAVINSPMTREMTMKKTEEKNTVIANLKMSATSGEKFSVQYSKEVSEHISKEELTEKEKQELIKKGRIEVKPSVGLVRPMKDEEISEEYGVFIDFGEKLQSDIVHLRIPLDSRKVKNPLIARPGKRRFGAKFVREELKRMKLERRVNS